MREYFLFMVLPFLAPPVVAAWKGPCWGIALACAQLLVLAASMLGLGVFGDPYTATAWLISTLFAICIVGLQGIAFRLIRRRNAQ